MLTDGDHIENLDTVSLQAVTLVDGSTAYIQHNPKGKAVLSPLMLLTLRGFSLLPNVKRLSYKMSLQFYHCYSSL